MDENCLAEQQYLAGERETAIQSLRNDPDYYTDQVPLAEAASANG